MSKKVIDNNYLKNYNMKMKYKIIFFLFFISYNVFPKDNDLLNEYKLLYNDLKNMRTVSYKSYFDNNYNMASENINLSQGALFMTEIYSDVAIVGEGYFKIRLDNDEIGWTRLGYLAFDNDFNIIVNYHYSLCDNINLPENSIPQSLRITKYGNIYVNIYDGRNNITEVLVGQLLIYNVPNELLIRYSDCIYTLREDSKYIEDFSNSYIIQGALEISNVLLLPVLLRMYYILSIINKEFISNIELKKELIKIQIERIANNNYNEDLFLSINNSIDRIENILSENYKGDIKNGSENNNFGTQYRQSLRNLPGIQFTYPNFDVQIHLENQYNYLDSILPYLEFNY